MTATDSTALRAHVQTSISHTRSLADVHYRTEVMFQRALISVLLRRVQAAADVAATEETSTSPQLRSLLEIQHYRILPVTLTSVASDSKLSDTTIDDAVGRAGKRIVLLYDAYLHHHLGRSLPLYIVPWSARWFRLEIPSDPTLLAGLYVRVQLAQLCVILERSVREVKIEDRWYNAEHDEDVLSRLALIIIKLQVGSNTPPSRPRNFINECGMHDGEFYVVAQMLEKAMRKKGISLQGGCVTTLERCLEHLLQNAGKEPKFPPETMEQFEARKVCNAAEERGGNLRALERRICESQAWRIADIFYWASSRPGNTEPFREACARLLLELPLAR